jgi:hypothetical protein
MSLTQRLTTKAFRLRVKQHAAVLDFVTELEDAMSSRNMTQGALASVLDKSRAWVSKVLRRKPNLTFFTAVELADAVGMDMKISLTDRTPVVRTLNLELPVEQAGWSDAHVDVRPVPVEEIPATMLRAA